MIRKTMFNIIYKGWFIHFPYPFPLNEYKKVTDNLLDIDLCELKIFLYKDYLTEFKFVFLYST